MEELELGGNKYRTARLNAFEQFHITRRLAPIMAGLGKSFSQLIDSQKDKPQDDTPVSDDDARKEEAEAFGAFGPVAETLSKMTDEEVNYILKVCLVRVHRFNGQNWVAVMSSNGQLMYEDIDMGIMIQLVLAMLRENIGSFFNAAPVQNSAGALP